MKQYLSETNCIDFNHPLVMERVEKLKQQSADPIDYIRCAFEFVRDEITHSWDAGEMTVSRKASEVLENGTGICWTKSCLLAALLRANGIPAGISYQKLTRADEDASDGYIIHALNTVYIEALDKWIRLDARGNKETVHAEFSLEEEILAFPVRPELEEIDYRNNDWNLDERLIKVLQDCESVLTIRTDFDLA
ncbi:MAG: transglutaminase-like domain-containing protein [bacterium]|nr:transglutaminase-like domain-containing protein [bacterium]